MERTLPEDRQYKRGARAFKKVNFNFDDLNVQDIPLFERGAREACNALSVHAQTLRQKGDLTPEEQKDLEKTERGFSIAEKFWNLIR